MSPTAPLATNAPPRPGFDRAAAYRAIGLSLFINAVCPYLLYRTLEPRFPAGSVMPLVYSSLIPLFGLIFGSLRQRTVDAVALIVLFEISINFTAVALTSSVASALVGRALSSAMLGAMFMLSVVLGRPVFFYIARQFVAAGDPEHGARLDAVAAADGMRTFKIATLVWASGLVVLSGINVTLALTVAPAQYLLLAPILGTSANLMLVWWSVRFSSRRLAPQALGA